MGTAGRTRPPVLLGQQPVDRLASLASAAPAAVICSGVPADITWWRRSVQLP